MTEQTKKGEKFAKARQFMKENPRVATRLVNWQKMHGPTLYRALGLAGVVWDVEDKCWRASKKGDNEAPALVSVSPARTVDESLIVKVRIIADESQINRSLSNLLEMAGALDWVLLRNSGVRKGHYGSGRLVYLVFRIPTY